MLSGNRIAFLLSKPFLNQNLHKKCDLYVIISLIKGKVKLHCMVLSRLKTIDLAQINGETSEDENTMK